MVFQQSSLLTAELTAFGKNFKIHIAQQLFQVVIRFRKTALHNFILNIMFTNMK